MRAPTEPSAKPAAAQPDIPALRDLKYRLEYFGLRILISVLLLWSCSAAGQDLLDNYKPEALEQLGDARYKRGQPDQAAADRAVLAVGHHGHGAVRGALWPVA